MKHRCYYIPRKDNKEYRNACDVYVERHALKTKSRAFDYVIQRQVLAWLMKSKGCSLTSAGLTLDQDHSLISYSVKKVDEMKNIGDKETIIAIEQIGREIDEILNNNQKNEKKMRPYYLNANSNYPAMTQEQWERAPFNQPTQDEKEFETTAYYTMTAETTITTDDWYQDEDRLVVNESNSKTPDITPEDLIKWTIGALDEQIKLANKEEMPTLKELLAYAKTMKFEHDENEVEDIFVDYYDDRYIEEVRYEMERERKLLGD